VQAKPAEGGAIAAAAKPATGEESGKASKPAAAKPATGGATANAPEPVAGGAHAALVQITVSLYRALAAEAALGFAVHAAAKSDGQTGDQPELAAQLALDLDNGAEPAVLRRFWDSLGRLSHGVFWPPEADETLVSRDLRDQGMREIIALATAGQAFQVCSGRVVYQTTIKESAERTAETTSKGSTDLKEVIGRVSTLGVGALTGVSLLGTNNASPIAAIAAGLAVWLLGNFSINWSSTRKRTSNRSVDYVIIQDRSLATLDRDLPLVIQRVREAGLAPVFVIDELDKVKDARSETGEIVKRLKHLVTDYGFFCFLVDRFTYDEIEQEVENKAYPVEHTYFSQRLLVRSEPQQLMIYLAQILKEEPRTPEGDFARTVFALAVMHRAKFNLADLVRAIAHIAGAGSELRLDNLTLTSPKQLFTATVQASINQILQKPDIAARMTEDPSFAQLAIDTLYYPSRCWARGETRIPASEADLRRYLAERMAIADAVAGERLRSEIGLLHDLLIELLEDLATFPTLRLKLMDRPAFDGTAGSGLPQDIMLASVIPSTSSDAMVKPLKGPSPRYEFLYDLQGIELRPPQGPWLEERGPQAKTLVEVARLFDEILAKAGVAFDELADVGLLPPIASQADFAVVREGVRAALDTGRTSAELVDGLDRLSRLENALRAAGDRIGPAVILAASVARDAGSSARTLTRISRLVDLAALPDQWMKAAQIGIHPIAPDVSALTEWRNEMGNWLLPKVSELPTIGVDVRYEPLIRPIERFLTSDPTATLDVPAYDDLIRSALDEAPLRFQHFRLSAMRARDWSGMALEAMPRRSGTARAPYWVLIAAFRALGFGEPLLGQLADPDLFLDLQNSGWLVATEKMTSERCMAIIQRLRAGAQTSAPGLLLVASAHNQIAGNDAPSRRRPTMVIGEDEERDYVGPLAWLEALGAFAGLAEEGLGPGDEGQTV
jgi:hypothetical protein